MIMIDTGEKPRLYEEEYKQNTHNRTFLSLLQ